MKRLHRSGSVRLTIAVLSFSILALSAQHAAAQEFGARKFSEQSGDALYRDVCQGCHMPDAMGAAGAGAYPRLASNPHLVEPSYPIMMVVSGHKAMPAFGRYMDDTQVANVVNYVRTHFGNHYSDAVTPADVARARPTPVAPKENTEHK